MAAAQRQRLVEHYAARAVTLPSEAGKPAAEAIGQGPDFEPLQLRKDFQDLLRRK